MSESLELSALLESLYNTPTQHEMLARIRDELDWEPFERFIEYVFQRAGYTTENSGLQFGQGIDVKLHAGTVKLRPGAGISIKHHKQEGNKVNLTDVMSFNTFILNAGIAQGYVVTNTGFTKPATDAFGDLTRVAAIDGERLFRYIAYVRGSRLANSQAPLIEPDWLDKADAFKRRNPQKSRILAVANNKGGVGKTTTALYLGRRFAESGQKVLLVDLDSQTNLTETLPNPHGEKAAPLTLVDYFEGRAGLSQLVRPTLLPRLYIIPCDPGLRLALSGIKSGPADELRFAEQLHGPDVRPPHFMDDGEFDWIIIDTPPDMTYRTRVALAAAHYVVAPFEVGPYPKSGLQQLFETVRAIRGLTGSSPQVLGCVVTKWQDNQVNRDALLAIKTEVLIPNHVRLFETRIKLDPNIVKDEKSRFQILKLGGKPAAVQYTQLAEEISKYA